MNDKRIFELTGIKVIKEIFFKYNVTMLHRR